MQQGQQDLALMQQEYERMMLQDKMKQLGQPMQPQAGPQRQQRYPWDQQATDGTGGGGMMLGSPSAESGSVAGRPDPLAQLEAEHKRKKLESEMEGWADKARLSKLQNETKESELAGKQFKQDAWMKSFSPYVQQLGVSPSDMPERWRANPLLGMARDASYVWGGKAEPWKRQIGRG